MKVSTSKTFLTIALTLTSCSDSKNYPDPLLTNITSGESIVFSDDSPSSYAVNTKYISNEGLLNYLEPLTLNLKGRFALEEEQENIFLEVHSYTSSMQKPDGFYLLFKPNVESQSLSIFFFLRSTKERSICNIPFAFSKNGDFNIKVQIQNSMNSSHFAIWNMYEDVNSSNFILKKRFNFNSADCSSNQNLNFSLDLLGLGSFWGITLNYVEIKSIKRETPYVL